MKMRDDAIASFLIRKVKTLPHGDVELIISKDLSILKSKEWAAEHKPAPEKFVAIHEDSTHTIHTVQEVFAQ